MLIQFEKTSGRATVDYQPGRSHMREGASRNPSFLSRCGAALIDIAAVFAVVLLVLATGVGITFAGFALLFCSLK